MAATAIVTYKSSKMEHPMKIDVTNLKRIFPYLNGNNVADIRYNGEMDDDLYVYCDTNYAEDEIDRRSTIGLVIMFKGEPVLRQHCRLAVQGCRSGISRCTLLSRPSSTEYLISCSTLCSLQGKTLTVLMTSQNYNSCCKRGLIL